MSKIWRDADVSLAPLEGLRIAILGFGSQGRAQALNLRDSGIAATVGVREGKSAQEAAALGFDVLDLSAACASADVIALLLPESAHEEMLHLHVNPKAKDGASLIFAHGYTAHYSPGLIRKGLNRLLAAPKAIGPQLRRLYESGSGAPCLVAAEPGNIEIAKAYAKALGCGRAAIIESSFREETETDLFGEQAVLCGGMPALALAAFHVLLDAGYSPEAAYFECVYEIKLIADLMFERGIAGMAERISDTAKFGAMLAGTEIVDERTKQVMQRILQRIRSGEFAEKWSQEQRSGRRHVDEWMQTLLEDQAEKTRAKLTEK